MTTNVYQSPSCQIVEMVCSSSLLQGSAGMGNLVDFDSDSSYPGNAGSLEVEKFQ